MGGVISLKHILLLLVFLLLFTSCTPIRSGDNEQRQRGTKIADEKPSIYRYSENEKAKRIANSILLAPGVKKVVVVVNGKMALIGLDIDSKKEDDKNYYKEIAIRETQKVDKNISNIEVTTDKIMYDRIQKLNDDIKKERPLRGILQDFMSLFKLKK